MATVSTLPQARRRKQATYGKASRNVSAWNLSLDELDDHEPSATRTPFSATERSVHDVYQVQKPIPKPHAPKTIKPRTKKQDSWDVPSSEDEEVVPVKRKSPPKVLARRKVASSSQEMAAQLAPWEKSKTEVPPAAKNIERRRKEQDMSPDDQLISDLTRSLSSEDATLVVPEPPPTQALVDTRAPGAHPSPNASSAIARLQARKLQVGSKSISNQKRLGDASDLSSETPRKRVRTESHEENQNFDIVMDDAPPVRCDSVPNSAAKATNEMDIYDFPESSADEATTVKAKSSPRKPTQQRSRRGKLTKYSSPQKMESAPARLTEMLPTDTDTTETTTRSPSMTPSRSSTPHQGSSGSKAATPDTALKRSASMTPKQAQLWDRLLPSEPTAASPSALKMRELSLSARRAKTAVVSHSQPLPGSAMVLGPRRQKLVDRLKASAPSSDDESSDQDETESSVEDVDMDAQTSSDVIEETPTSQSQSQSQQSQSQASYAGKSGPEVTYARTRSYLPEDSFEDQLLLDFPGEAPQRPAVAAWSIAGKSQSTSQKSTFDLDESDEEDDGGRMRTIHELRAGGTTQRFLDSLGGLLEDIRDHNASARSRRRSALIELAAKLVEKPFLEKFFRHGHEQQLIKECSAAPDDIADFVLAAIFVSIVADEAPDHVTLALRDGNVLSWFGRLVTNGMDTKKLAKDRRNNMSKSAQMNFAQFADSFVAHDKIWGDDKPALLTPRTLVLKGYDLLIRKLRLLGDRSELVEIDALKQLAPTEGEVGALHDRTFMNVSASISALESLSTIALSLTWPTDVVGQLRDLLITLRSGDEKTQHLRFLTLRLSLNLTNENGRNCRIYSQQAMITYLLRVISDGFQRMSEDDGTEDEQRTINLDLLVLSVGVMTNLAQHNKQARQYAAAAEARSLLSSIAEIFHQGQKQLIEAESVEQGVNNVAYGYLAVMLADLCGDNQARAIIASKLPRGNLNALVDAVEEFVRHHQSVDKLNFAGEEGGEVWSAFTEKLRGVLERLKVEAEKME